jgi:hypothetical protein
MATYSTGFFLFSGAISRLLDPDLLVWCALIASILMVVVANLSYLAAFDRAEAALRNATGHLQPSER